MEAYQIYLAAEEARRQSKSAGASGHSGTGGELNLTINEAVVSNELAYFSLNALSKKLGHLHFVVVNADNQLRGMISLDDLDVPEDEFLRNLILIEDMVVDNVSPLDPEDNLHEALQRLLDSGYDKLPVVETAADGEESFRGYIMYLDLMRVYNEEVAKFEGKE